MTAKRQHKPAKLLSMLLLSVAAIAGIALLQSGKGKLYSVQSGSMAPAINKGTLVQVNRVPPHEIVVGDVITFVSPDKSATITHRVTALLEADPSGNRFVTKGDANTEADMPIEAASVIGRVDRSVPYLGFAIDFIKQPVGLIAIIYIPALMIIMGETKRLVAFYRRMQPYLLYGFKSRLFPELHKKRSGTSLPATLLAITLVGITVLGGTALAELNSTAALQGNTIVINNVSEEPEPEPELPPQNTITCDNDTDVDISSRTVQSATSGNAIVTDNTTGGSATSGNASNSSSTEIKVEIDNNCVVSEHEEEAELLPEAVDETDLEE